jgi:hypothetical protein
VPSLYALQALRRGARFTLHRPARTGGRFLRTLFDETNRAHWLVAEDPWRKILEMRPLPAGTDLVRTFLGELMRYHDSGWRLNEFSTFSASFYATKEYEAKRYIYIALEDPSVPPFSLRVSIFGLERQHAHLLFPHASFKITHVTTSNATTIQGGIFRAVSRRKPASASAKSRGTIMVLVQTGL